MAIVVEYVQNIWPFSAFVYNDLRESDRIVKKLPIPESTKHFVYAIREPESQAVIYVLCVQSLSERSVMDAECLIREIKPDAVVVQVGGSNNFDVSCLQKCGAELMIDGKCKGTEADDERAVPTSSFEVLKNCFVHKINKEKYEDVAGSLVLKEIFGVGFYEHFVTAKKASEEVGSSFLVLESPFVNCSMGEDVECNMDTESEVMNFAGGFQTVFGLQLSNLVRGRIGSSMVSQNRRAFYVTDNIQSQMVKSMSSYLVRLSPVSEVGSEDVRPLVDYEVPQFAKSVYPLLTDLHDIFYDIPSMKTALACAQKMLCDVNKGEKVDGRLLSEVYAFQIAVEGLRIALTNAGRVSLGKSMNKVSASNEFSKLPEEEKSQAILARALRSQTKKYKSVVAVVDASGLAGLRKHWRTTIPLEVENMVEQLITNIGEDGDYPSNNNRKRLLADKPMVAVGAGATAILGASSLSKVIPASTYIKIATFHVPASLKLILTQTQKAFLLAFGKALGPTKMAAPGMASTTLKSSAVKAAASAEKIRMVAHSFIASAEKTSLSAMRTAFYEIMRKRRVRPIGVLPWATFGCSVATCTGLLLYGDGIECAAESLPIAPSIASLGRGIQSLHQASQVVKEAESFRIQKSIESLLYKFKNIKIQ